MTVGAQEVTVRIMVVCTVDVVKAVELAATAVGAAAAAVTGQIVT